MLRCLATLAVSTASYLLVERPVRVGWPRRLPGPAGNAVVTAAALAVVGALVVATTAVGARVGNDKLLTSGTRAGRRRPTADQTQWKGRTAPDPGPGGGNRTEAPART